MPNQPRDDNPARAIRVPDKLWAASKKRAEEKGETVSEAVRKFLDAYAEGTIEAMRRFMKESRR